MAKRLKIGLIYSYNKDWIAGAYYILNLIHALNQQNDERKPELIILSTSNEEFETVKSTGYPYLKYYTLIKKDFHVSYRLWERAINKLTRIVIGKNIIHREHTYKRLNIELDLLFPATTNAYFTKIKHKLFWIPDFQEYFLPQFFSEQEIVLRKTYKEQLASNAFPIVFSSYNALEHFKTLYPQSKSKTFILQFAVTHPVYEHIDIAKLLHKYKINKPYFFCPNQFWAHKNHITVLKSINILKQEKKDTLVIFSGKEEDYRNPGYFAELKSYVIQNGIENCVKFLGFIDRGDQLQLMANSIAVIQPSLFEGWSTVIEDTKSMGQHVIVSNLPVHREQSSDKATFFTATDEYELAGLISNFTKQPSEKTNYDINIFIFGKVFLEITEQLEN